MNSIERVPNLSKKEFVNNYLNKNKPVILTDVMTDWKAMTHWQDPNYLKEKIGNKKIDVAVSNNRMTLSPEKGWKAYRFNEMSFVEYINLITDDRQELKRYYYMQQQSLPKMFSELHGDITVPSYINTSKVDINLWIGSGGNITSIHFDAYSNFLAQVKGKKRLILYPPSDYRNLYPFPTFSKNVNLSPVNHLAPDLGKYPKFNNVRSYECVLNEGEMLFLPVFWWHAVETINDDMTISVNFWWDCPMKSYFSYLGARTIAHRSVKSITSYLKK